MSSACESSRSVSFEAARLFAKFDVDGDGVVSRADFMQAMQAMGSAGREPEALDAMFAAVDTDGDGLVRFDDFLQMQRQKAKHRRQLELAACPA